ncbi:MAG: glycoside hydrolase family 25 protein [Verrucomicrobiae bacterium]|nr:glycoside hydrolase family 25 protein [Verrucomicrobiae bacterium]
MMNRIGFTALSVVLVAATLLPSCATTTFPNFSHWDSIPSIATFPAKKTPAVIHRASRGTETDSAYRHRAQQCRQRPDIEWGAYHFCTGAPVQTQLSLALDRVGHSPGAANRTLMVFDFEKNVKGANDYMRVADLAELIRRFHARTGVYPVLYVNPGWFSRRLATDSYSSADRAVIRKCPLWTSAYRGKPSKVKGFPSWTIWQYSGDASLPSYGDGRISPSYPRGIPGVGSKLEMNLYRGSVESLRSFWGRHSIPTRF